MIDTVPPADRRMAANEKNSPSRLQRAREHAKIKHEIVLRYLREVGEGEPSLAWYRAIFTQYPSILVRNAVATLPYFRQSPQLRFSPITLPGAIDKRIRRLRDNTNEHFADLVAGFLDSQYALMHFGFDHGLFGNQNPIRLQTLDRHIGLIARYLEWLHVRGYGTLQDAGRMVFDEYMASVDAAPGHAYTLNQFYKWVKKKYPFATDVNFHRRGKGKGATRFETLNLDESRATFQRICQFPDPRGRALALLCLLYAQRVSASVTLRRDELVRDETAGCWVIARHGAEDAYRVELELSTAIDECLAGKGKGGERRAEDESHNYVFSGKTNGHLAAYTATALVHQASGIHASVLRRTGIINIYRGGQKTMGTVVLRDILKVSSPTLRKAIRATGESVNSPATLEEATALRQAFLDDDQDE